MGSKSKTDLFYDLLKNLRDYKNESNEISWKIKEKVSLHTYTFVYTLLHPHLILYYE